MLLDLLSRMWHSKRVGRCISPFQDKGVFRTTDAGEQWTRLNDGLMGRTISKMAAIGDTVFAGTDKGLYRLDAGVWERSLEDVSRSYSLIR